MISIGPGAESVRILLWAADAHGGRWDTASWDGATWSAPGWQSVGCDVAEATYKWGASQESGILSVAEAGELDLVTIDPNRELDPLNTASPYYGAVKPGTPIRIVGDVPGEVVAATAYIDVASYELGSGTGRIRAVDAIAYASQAQVPDGTVLPNTLRARTRAIIAAAGLSSLVPVEPEYATGEIIADGTAEMYPDAYTTPPPGWRIASGTGQFGTASAPVHTGARCFWLNDCEVVGDGHAAAQLVVPGAVYTLSAWHNREADFSPGQASLWLYYYDAAGGYLGHTQATAMLTWAAGRPVGVWEQQSARWTAPANAARVALGIVGAAGVDRFDDISLVGAIGGRDPDADPPVSPYDGKSAPAWSLISNAAQDALVYVWADPTGMLRFRSWGAFPDAPLAIGCPPADADPGEVWLTGIASLESTSAADAIRNSVRAESSAGVWAPAIIDGFSRDKYGPRPLDIQRVVPDRALWADRILADRGDAGLEVAVGELRPLTLEELAALLSMRTAGPSIVRVRDDAHGEVVDLDLGTIGSTVGITPAGWRWRLVTMLSRIEWDAIDPIPPVIPPNPTPPPFHTETRSYFASSDALITLTSGGAKYGAGASTSLPFGTWQGWTYRSLLAFPAIPWTKVKAVKAARLKVTTSTQVRIGFGSSPKTQIRRITGSWSAGSSSSPSSGNAVVWPGPTTTSSGAVTASLGTAQSTQKSIGVTNLVRPWAPSSAGGSGASQKGLALYEYSSSGSNTGEVWPSEKGSPERPILEIDLEVYD